MTIGTIRNSDYAVERYEAYCDVHGTMAFPPGFEAKARAWAAEHAGHTRADAHRDAILRAFDLHPADLDVLAEMSAAAERARRIREDWEARLGQRMDRIEAQINERLPEGITVMFRFDR
jgi:hypothetical protein